MTDLATFLGKRTAGGPEPSSETEITPPAETSAVYDVTPSGIEVMYQAAPKRLYKVRCPVDHGDTNDWCEVPSVTTVLDTLSKGGLTIWGMRVGVQGVLSLVERGRLTTAFDWTEAEQQERIALPEGEYATVESVEALLKEERLTTNDAKNSAADRGNIVHEALENWALSGDLPDPRDFDEREKGYVEGLVKFLEDAQPTPVRTEVMVGSVEHGFAGRYDLELAFDETRKVRKTPKQKWHEIEAGTFLVDAKSSKAVYPSTHFRQLAAYEAARVECGYPATDAQYVLNVNGEGSYAFVKSTATLEDFLAVLDVWKSDRSMKKEAA